MQMQSLKKIRVWLTLAALTMTGTTYAHSHHHHLPHPHHHVSVPESDRCALLERGALDWFTIISDINQISLAEGITSSTSATNPDIAVLVAAIDGTSTSTGTIAFAASDFGNLIQSLGAVDPQNVTSTLNQYALATLDYSSTLNSSDFPPTSDQLAAQANALNDVMSAAAAVSHAAVVAARRAPASVIIPAKMEEVARAQAAAIQNQQVINPAANSVFSVLSNAEALEAAAQISNAIILSLIDKCE
jgi:hypothetical protein